MKNTIFLLLAICIAGVWACSSSKKAYESGDYYSSVMMSVNKLRKNPSHKKTREILAQAYPMAHDYYINQIDRLKNGQDRFKNGAIYDNYKMLNNMYDEIRTSPGALQVISNPKDYYNQLKLYAKEAAAERYAAGEDALAMGTRNGAIDAYYHFVQANMYQPGYLDVNNKIEEAKYKGTLKVLVEQVPVPSMQAGLSAQFFQDQIEQFLFNYRSNEFIRFYSSQDNNLQDPDQILVLQFDDFVVGMVNNQERIIQTSHDSVILATVPRASVESKTEEKITICHEARGIRQTIEVPVSELQSHIDHGDKIGSCDGKPSPAKPNTPAENINVYGTVKATFRENTRQVISRGLMSMRILDARSNTVVLHEKFPGEFVWINRWGSFNGDERALNAEQLRIANQIPLDPPAPQVLFIEFCKPIYGQFQSKVQSYYNNL
ncbi:MAG: hypothetical protein HC819_17705 [Cyclobacteriaceae bacterium]|nr:hypothetical protein [Cyclobacteriaceae bacterium]